MLNRMSNHISTVIVGNISLTPREFECLDCLLGGRTAKQIGQMLQISPRTVEAHLAKIIAKLGCKTRLEVISKIMNLGN